MNLRGSKFLDYENSQDVRCFEGDNVLVRKKLVTKGETVRETERSIATGESSTSLSTLEQLCIIGVAAGP